MNWLYVSFGDYLCDHILSSNLREVCLCSPAVFSYTTRVTSQIVRVVSVLTRSFAFLSIPSNHVLRARWRYPLPGHFPIRKSSSSDSVLELLRITLLLLSLRVNTTNVKSSVRRSSAEKRSVSVDIGDRNTKHNVCTFSKKVRFTMTFVCWS